MRSSVEGEKEGCTQRHPYIAQNTLLTKLRSSQKYKRNANDREKQEVYMFNCFDESKEAYKKKKAKTVLDLFSLVSRRVPQPPQAMYHA